MQNAGTRGVNIDLSTPLKVRAIPGTGFSHKGAFRIRKVVDLRCSFYNAVFGDIVRFNNRHYDSVAKARTDAHCNLDNCDRVANATPNIRDANFQFFLELQPNKKLNAAPSPLKNYHPQ
jgi:hypothetical protein